MSSIKGVSITDNSRIFIDAKDQAVAQALEAIGMKAEGYAKRLCPVDTGRLRNSITHQQAGRMTEEIGTNVEYAAYVEMGTRRTKAQPYLRPAAEDHSSEYVNIAKKYLKQA